MPEQYANRANISSRINVAACRRQLRNPIGMMKAMFRQWRCQVNRIDHAGGCSFCNKELGGNGSYPNATANTSLSALSAIVGTRPKAKLDQRINTMIASSRAWVLARDFSR